MKGMKGSELDHGSLARLVGDTVQREDFRRATFGGAVRGPQKTSPWARVVVRPVDLRGQRHLQFSYFDAKKDVTKNYRGEEIAPRLQGSTTPYRRPRTVA